MNTKQQLICSAYRKARELYLGVLLGNLQASEARVTLAYDQHRADLTNASAAVLAAKEHLTKVQTEGSKAAEEVNKVEGSIQDELHREIANVNGESNE